MVSANKKRISSELLHIALVITLLRGNGNNRFYNPSPVISTNFFNDVSVSNNIMGQSWGYSRTAFHHLNHDAPLYDMKAFEEGSMDRINTDYFDDDLDVDLNIINQLRSLTISRFHSLPGLGKEMPTFQDITAYLLSESSSPSSAVSAPAPPTNAPDFNTPAVTPPPETNDDVEMTDLSETALLLSPGADSGHEEAGDDADINSTTSDKEFSLEITNAVPRNSHRRESYGFHSDSEEELVAHEIMQTSAEAGTNEIKTEKEEENEPAVVKEEIESEDSAEEEIPDIKPVVEEDDGLVQVAPDTGMDVKPIVEKVEDVKPGTSHDSEVQLWDEWLDDVTTDASGGLTSPLLQEISEIDQTTLELLEHVHRNEVGGAAGIDHSSSELSQLLGWQNDSFNSFPEYFLEAERSSLEFYKKFNDISETELENAVAPENIHEFEEDVKPSTSTNDDNNKPGTSSHLLANNEAKDKASSDDVGQELSDGTEDILSAMFDDLLESDSGVFDFLDSTSEAGDVARDNLSESSVDSPIDGDSNEENSAGVSEAEESSFSAEMIQTAPIHASARPTSHAAQPRGFQVHARMPGLLRGGSMEQRWQDLANLLSLQSSSHDPTGAGGLHQPLPHHFAPHPYHHHHHHHHHPHTAAPLHHSMHPPHFGGAVGVSPAAPYSTDTARSVLLQNATLPPPELNATGPYGNVGMGASSNLGSAVASSMHLTNSSEPMIDPSGHYKMMDPTHDMLYYQNSTNEMGNQTAADGFNLSSILNDDELQLMDMAMNEGMYSMRPMDSGVSSANLTPVGAPVSVGQGPQHNGAPTSSSCTVLGAAGGTTTNEDRMEASSDSAVSSMGSERVPPMTDPPMSDNEWVDTESHPHGGPHDLSPYSMDYSRYYKDGSRVAGPVAQKKHHMFGKRFQQEQGSHPYPLSSHLPYPSQHGSTSQGSTLDLDKYNCSGEFGRFNGQRPGPMDPTLSNHTYSLPPTHPDNPMMKTTKAPQKEKQRMIKYLKNDEALTRDEKKARAMQIPILTEDIINLPMDEFNERLSKYDLSEAQLSLIRDIRRRGKNKVAAQNCRKRKLDQILQLADEVQRIRERKQSLMREQEGLLSRRTDLKERYSLLYRTVFQALRDGEGHPYNPFEFNLHHAADGSVILVPRNSTQPSSSTTNHENSMGHSSNGRRDKPKEEPKKE